AGGTRLGSQHLPNGLDLTPRHCLLVPRVAVERTPGVSTQAISPQQVNASCSKPGFGALEYPRPGLGAGCRGGHSGVRAVGGGTPMNRTRRVVALILRRLGFLALAPLCGCALNTVPVSPPMAELTTDASLGAGRVVLVELPFKDDRPDRTRCGMTKNSYGMDTANVDCTVPPKQFVAEQLVHGLRAAGFSVTEAQSADPLRVEGTLTQFFLEPKVDAFTFTPEADVGVRLVATSASGLRAGRDFYVKGEEVS